MCGLTLPTVEIKGRLKKQIYKHWLDYLLLVLLKWAFPYSFMQILNYNNDTILSVNVCLVPALYW